ncbi:hypothetical protein AB3S75_008131 [Citrus x aurantiifolia]
MLTIRAKIQTFTFAPRSFYQPSMGFMNYPNQSTLTYKHGLYNHIKNQRIDLARKLFDEIPSPNSLLYTIMITGYAQKGRINDALNLFEQMPVRDTISWNSMLKGCFDCGKLCMAETLFDKMPERNVVSWTTMVNGYFQFGRIDKAESLFYQMPVRDVAAWNAMIHGYFCYGRVEDAIRLFDEMPCRNVISWTSMIGGLDCNGKTDESFLVFKKMVGYGILPTATTLACVLAGCAHVLDLYLGLQIHGCVIKIGLSSDEFICASLITFYANCKLIEDTSKVFNEKLHKNVVVWTALLTGNGLNGKHETALKVFSDMINLGVLPNQSTFVSVLNSCIKLEAIDHGKEIHTVAIKLGLVNDVFVGNSLVVMYSECGNVIDAVAIFRKIDEKNIVSWNSMIVGSAQHGFGRLALTLYSQMIREGVDPDEITFTGLLSACSHSGMLQKGRYFFEYISRYKPNEVKLQHFACMVDILGRGRKLEEAEELIKNMPLKANSMVWLALLSSCRMHSNAEVAERAAKEILDLEPHCSAAYVLLSNLYASAGRWSDVSRLRVKMKQGGIVKQPGCSWVYLKGTRHEFLSGDRSHPLSEKIYEKLDWLGGKLKEFGYCPERSYSLHDVEDEQKEEMLSFHSERLAIGFALITTVEGSTITVMKNLRVCGDCHHAIKLISKIVRREIVVRDSSRFHHFRSGSCSCRDYW